MKKKIIALCLVIALAATAVIGGTLAYFTDTTEAKVNEFTVGNVDIDLTEPKWKGDATLMPGVSYDKDPTITVAQNSEDAYLFLDVIFNKYNSLFWVMAADASADEDIAFTIFNDDGTVKQEYKNGNGQFATSKFMAAMQEPANKAVFQQIVNKWFGGITHTDWEQIYFAFGNDNEVDNKMLTVRLAYIGGENDGILKAGDSVTFMTSFGMPASVTQ